MTQKEILSHELMINNLKYSLDKAASALNEFTKLAEGSQELREYAMNEIAQYALSIRASKIDKTELESFFKYPYCILPGKKPGECYLAIPKFIDSHFGWLYKVTPSYNIFLVNQYVDWLGELPLALKKEMKFPDPLDIHLDGDYLVGPDIKKVADKYSNFVTKQKDGRLLVDKTRHFEMLSALIKDGILPFVPKPVNEDDLVKRRCDIELRDYQKEAWKEFLKYSNIGAFFPPSTGKTYISIYALTHVIGPHIVAVPSRLLVEQWIERIELYTDLKVTSDLTKDAYDVYVTTYQSAIKSKRKYKLKIIDEVHHLPANDFSKLSTIECEYSIGLSATPQREDDREDLIFALTGKPVGLSWEVFKKLGIIQNPTMHVWIVKNEVERIKQIERLIQSDQKTIIFCDSIDMGKIIAKRFEVPHIHGASKERLASIQESKVSVVSRVGDEGVSIPDIEKVIEVSWLHGSRRQELQRFTRLLHGKGTQGEAHIIMTIQEYQTDHKRLFGLFEKGFKIVLHNEGEKEKTFESVPKQTLIRNYTDTKKTLIRSSKVIKTEKTIIENNELDESKYPLLKFKGIRKIVESLTKPQRALLLFLIDPSNHNQSFTLNGLAMSLGYKRPESLLENDVLTPLVKKGYVIKNKNENKKTEYKQNFSQMVK